MILHYQKYTFDLDILNHDNYRREINKDFIGDAEE